MTDGSSLEVALLEKDAELDRLRRGSLRAESERARAEALAVQLGARDQELLEIRERTQRALLLAENELASAAMKIVEVSAPRPVPSAGELNDARVRAARLSAELAELRSERDELRLKLEGLSSEIDGARASSSALRSAISTRDERAGTAEAARQAAEAKVQAALDEAAGARVEQDRLAKGEEEARAAAAGALQQLVAAKGALEELKVALAESRAGLVESRNAFKESQGALDLVRREEQALEAELARLQAELEGDRAAARAREAQLAIETRAREVQLGAAAQAREAQLVATAQQDQKDNGEQLAALTRAGAEAREHEAALDAELRLARGTQEQFEGQLESARADVRRLLAEAQIASDSAHRAEARVTELQSVVDSLGRERAALRSEAGAMRARVELLSAADERSRKLNAELEELRGENDFLNQELARSNSSRTSLPPPLPSKT